MAILLDLPLRSPRTDSVRADPEQLSGVFHSNEIGFQLLQVHRRFVCEETGKQNLTNSFKGIQQNQTLIRKFEEKQNSAGVQKKKQAGRKDVAILNGSEVVYGFEVLHRYKVPELKGQQIKIRWMELVAEDILAFKPRIPFGYETSSSLCPDCIELKAYLAARKPEDLKRSKTSEEHSKAAQKLRRTWHGIVEEARNFDREMRKRSVSD